MADYVLAKWHSPKGHFIAPRRPISELRGRYAGQDIWVIGAAKSMDFVDPSFFDNKVTICTNHTYRKFPHTYVVGKELEQGAYNDVKHTLITSSRVYGMHDQDKNVYIGSRPYYGWQHRHNTNEEIDYSILGTDEIIVGKSTITSSMHVAAYLGAKNIMLCGVDGGTLDGELTYDGYYDSNSPHGYYRYFIRAILKQTLETAKRLREFYGCQIYSLNPFLNFNFEGHVFDPA